MDYAYSQLEDCTEPLYDLIQRPIGQVCLKWQIHRIIYRLD
jgi:hypothetical protein